MNKKYFIITGIIIVLITIGFYFYKYSIKRGGCSERCEYSSSSKSWTYYHSSVGNSMIEKEFETQKQCVDSCMRREL